MKKRKFGKDTVVGICCIAVSLLFSWQSRTIRASLNPGDPGPKLFPLIGCGILLICGLLMLLKRPEDKDAAPFLPGVQLKRALLLLGMYFLMFVLMYLFGFLPCVFIMLFVLCCVFLFTSRPEARTQKRKSILRAAVYALVLTAVIYAAYDLLLGLQLPSGKLLS